jgi:hypothetical protein
MSLIIRIDVDRPYGRAPLARHLLSRLSSDLYFPTISGFGYLKELETMLGWLNEAGARAHLFFRRCTLPTGSLLRVIEEGRHGIGLHLENSRSFDSFCKEIQIIEQRVGKKISAFSKHGSGGSKFGFHHYAPYEPERYIEWAQRASMRLFLGNLQDPTLAPAKIDEVVTVFPSAFWLEPHWRNTQRFTVDWLLEHARHRDIVLLVHPENVLADRCLVDDFKKLTSTLESRVI